jgi:hypothetical protein
MSGRLVLLRATGGLAGRFLPSALAGLHSAVTFRRLPGRRDRR